MPNLNAVYLMGNLTRDPDVRYTPKGTAVAELGLAIKRVWTDNEGAAPQKREEVTFVDVTLWARLAEIAQQYLHKGSPVFIEGRLQLDTWDDKHTGQKRSKLRVVGENLQLLGSRPESGSTAPSRTGDAPASARGASPRPATPRDPDLDAQPDDRMV